MLGMRNKRRVRGDMETDIKLATLNIATLRDKVEKVVDLMKTRKINICGLCATRFETRSREIVHEDYILINSGHATKKAGVAFVISPELSNCIINCKYINNRIVPL